MDPLSLSAGVVGLVSAALKLVVGAIGMVDKTIAAYDEAGDELEGLQQDLEELQTHIAHIHETLQALASNTKDQGFKRLLRECVLGYSLGDVDRSQYTI
jgi:septal ring factor EnvC (AmiA/AmiB activator)